MQHTYLRYECADAFSLSCSSSPSTPVSSSILAFLEQVNNPPLLSIAGSHVIGYDLRRGEPLLKLGHRERSSVGTGRALNSSQVVCVSASRGGVEGGGKVATGWIDGSIRVFSLEPGEVEAFSGGQDGGLVHSLLERGEDEEFACREPLVLQGHGSSPVQIVVFDALGRLASGGADGVVILWDVVAETGLFRLLGHRGPVTGISFLSGASAPGPGVDGLVTSGMDGLVKVWDLEGQCCVQTLTGHRGSVGCLDCMAVRPPENSKNGITGSSGDNGGRWRLVTGCVDGQVRLWGNSDGNAKDENADDRANHAQIEKDDVFQYMGTVHPPPNTHNEGISSVRFHPNGRYLGICRTKVVDVYALRSELETQKKRKRRLRRRREKLSSSADVGKKRGLLDDEDEPDGGNDDNQDNIEKVAPESTQAMDEFEYLGSVRTHRKLRGFAFAPHPERGGGIRIVVALSTNAFEIHSLSSKATKEICTLDMYGHPTGIRAMALSSEDAQVCTLSKNVMKLWNVAHRSCLRSLTMPSEYYCLCASFLPGNSHVAVGTREGRLLLIDVASGDIVHVEERAHEGAIWSLDWHTPESVSLITGSADKTVKYWDIESQDNSHHPMVVHARTLQMSEDVMCVKCSYSSDPTKRLLFVATLDSTIKVFFDDSLKFFLNLYGHKLPVLAFDSSDDDVLLASGGADKSIKIWGLDFGDTHRTLYGHEDSVTDLRFVRRTHNFFTASKDGSLRYWDADRFEQILCLNGHAAEVCCLAMSRTGAFVLSGGMDRQVRVWERTKDIVFLDEEKERALEEMFDKVDGSRQETTADVLGDEEVEDKPQSEAAVKQTVLSVSSGDRIMEAIETADQETKEIVAFRKLNKERGTEGKRAPNPMLFGMDPPRYVLWILRSVKSVDLEQSLLVLPLNHVERLMHYLVLLLRARRGVELCAKVAVFITKTHQSQIVANRTMMTPLRELNTLVRQRTTEIRDVIGFNLAAMRCIARIANEKKQERINYQEKSIKDVWAGLGLGKPI